VGKRHNPDLQAELTRRGVMPKSPEQLLARVLDPYLVLDQLDWADYLIGRKPDGFYNPAGFCLTVFRDNVPVPSTFEASRHARAEGEHGAKAECATHPDSGSNLRFARRISSPSRMGRRACATVACCGRLNRSSRPFT
jgi:hypothetical protein